MTKTKDAGAVEQTPPPKAQRILPIFDDLGPNAPKFVDYFERHIEYIKEVQSLLSSPLSDSPVGMDQQAREAEAHSSRMASILAWADSYLDVAEHVQLRAMPPRDPRDWTDMDRDRALKAAVTRERRFRDVVRGLCESIERRVSYTQSRLRTFTKSEFQSFQI
jgi:hypothetical protein